MDEKMVNDLEKPTEKQLAAIRNLARVTSTSVNLTKIATKQEASRMIESLIQKRNGNTTNSNNNDLRDKKAAFGLVTKLVFSRYETEKLDYKAEKFWQDVDEFYREYVKNQNRAVTQVLG